MEKESPLIYKTTACKILGITLARFNGLGLEPEKEVPNPHYRTGSTSYLYDKEKIEKLRDSPKIIALRPKQRKPKVYDPIFKRKFGIWEKALPTAAAYMFSLNRYCKHSSCSANNREEIYGLKNRFIKLLYQEGYCEAVHLHEMVLPEKRCLACAGSGWHEWDQDTCYRCEGTGIYLPEKVLEFFCFEIEVGGERYTWHQPKGLVGFEVTVSKGTKEIPPIETKPLLIEKAKLTEGKRLVSWVLKQAGKITT